MHNSGLNEPAAGGEGSADPARSGRGEGAPFFLRDSSPPPPGRSAGRKGAGETWGQRRGGGFPRAPLRLLLWGVEGGREAHRDSGPPQDQILKELGLGRQASWEQLLRFFPSPAPSSPPPPPPPPPRGPCGPPTPLRPASPARPWPRASPSPGPAAAGDGWRRRPKVKGGSLPSRAPLCAGPPLLHPPPPPPPPWGARPG